MLYLKSCIRCKGDVHLNSDWYGEVMTCLQCGWSKDVSPDTLGRLAELLGLDDASLSARKAS